jgi:uncharacterized protein (DUF983 family)
MDNGDSQDTKGQPGIPVAALFGLCPQCGARGLFAGVVQFAPNCRECGLDYRQFNVGDGPAAFLTFIVGGVVVGLALWVELTWSPPAWVHALLWLPMTAVLTLGGLRIAKATLLTAEYQRRAVEATGEDINQS